MNLVNDIKKAAVEAIETKYGLALSPDQITVNETKPEFEGDYTIVLFSFVKQLKKAPDALGLELGDLLLQAHPGLFIGFNVIKGFLNLTLNDEPLLGFLIGNHYKPDFGKRPPNHQKVMVEYSSPNTNKPLHLGHLRNNFLGWSTAAILQQAGYEVIKSCIVNDRGIHICKSMIAWQRFANGATPQSTGTKGDHFVGDYYVRFNDAYKAEVDALVAGGVAKELAEKEAPIMKATQEMLVKWEQGDAETMALWKQMNEWVYAGFDETYNIIGSDFDRTYYESQTYLLGKDTVQKGLEQGILFKKEDGSVWIDLTADGLDQKLVLRKDGTSVYITQDIGLAQDKYNEYHIDQSIYVIADEQNYHMQVLKLIAQKLGLPNANGIQHLSYGMVELPSGRMKSREGTVVDADDLVAEMVATAARETEASGKAAVLTDDEKTALYNILGMGAMKFYLLKVDPKKKMIFNPEESIDMQGFTGPYIQYTHARSKSILREQLLDRSTRFDSPLMPLEKELLKKLELYPQVVLDAAAAHNPAIVANYTYNLCQTTNSFFAKHHVIRAESEEKKQLRLQLLQFVTNVIKSSMALLGVQVPERM